MISINGKKLRKIERHPIMSAERSGLQWAYFDTAEIIIELLDRKPDAFIV